MTWRYPRCVRRMLNPRWRRRCVSFCFSDCLPILTFCSTQWILVAAGHVVRSKNDKSFSNNASFRNSAEDSLDTARKVLVAVTPWALAHNHSLRVFAQLATHALLEAFGADAFEAKAFFFFFFFFFSR